jgi:glycosyltransferase involved in cell wall biosynthesis
MSGSAPGRVVPHRRQMNRPPFQRAKSGEKVGPIVKTESSLRTIAFLGNYLPRKCGIATFTSDLLGAVAARHPQSRCFAVAVNDIDGCYQYPDIVRFEIEEQDLGSYRGAADYLNSINVDTVSIQHEFGIFGGPAGSHLLAVLEELKAPVVTTLHTVLRTPNADQRRVMRELVAHSTRLVVMAERGRTILREVYDAPPAKIDLIPHGIPDVPFVAPDYYKDLFGVSGKKVLLTFGLLSPNKGIENVLNALPEIVAEFPDVVYILLGATHPHELRTRGESYRLGLEAIVKEHKLEKHVIFHNRFVELKELTEFIGSADLYITPYLDEAQSTSGTLAYAFGAGKAVISTPYWHAAELLRDQRGVLVPFGDPRAIAREASGLLRDEARRGAMSDNAYRLGREMVWSNTAGLYMRSFEAARQQGTTAPRKSVAARESGYRPYESPELNLNHLYHMTDSTGIFQHASFTTPNLAEGYCTDDNARALILAVLLDQLEEAPKRVRALATTYAAFLDQAFDSTTKRFHNFLSSDRRWLDEQGSEDCHGRAIWALGTAVRRAPHWGSRRMAERLFAQALPAVTNFAAPRAWAFSLIGIDEYLGRLNGDRLAEDVRAELTERLMAIFDQVAAPGWSWFEEGLTYDNAKLAHALIVSGRATGQRSVYERGLQALRWLVGVQTSRQGQLRPIGSNGFYRRNGARADFDQQPIEAQTTVSACLEAYRATADPWWYGQAQRAFDWFLGRNDLGLELYARQSGGCRDGLHADRGNENQGAESTLAFLLSQAEMRLIQNTATLMQGGGMAAATAH